MQEVPKSLTFKVKLQRHLYANLNYLEKESRKCVDRMIQNRTASSTKDYPEVPSVISKALIRKYQRNTKLKKVSKLVIPVCGDKGKQVKVVTGGIRIPAVFKKEVIQVVFPKPVVGFIRHVEVFKINKEWYLSYSYNVSTESSEIISESYIGVDRNSVGNVVTLALPNGKVVFLGPDSAGITKNFRNRRAKLQRKGAKHALKRIRNKQSNRIKDINHKVSRHLVDFAKEHRSAIVLEDLSKVNSKKSKIKRYVNKSQWSYFQLEVFIKYKAALLGIPVYYVNASNTSKECNSCGEINTASGKLYKCKCGYVAHRDANAALNISRRMLQSLPSSKLGLIGNPLNRTFDKANELKS